MHFIQFTQHMEILCADTHSQQPTAAPPGRCRHTALLYVPGVLCSPATSGLGHALHSPWLPVHSTSPCRIVDSLWTQLRPLLCYLFSSSLRCPRQSQKGMIMWNLPEFVTRFVFLILKYASLKGTDSKLVLKASWYLIV